MQFPVIDHDVLVIGAGGAGLRAAIEASVQGAKVGVLTKSLLGALVASTRQGNAAAVVNVSSDAATSAYPGWGAYSASKAALHHMTRIWQEELSSTGVRMLSFDPGDMDTPLHATAVPDADRASLKDPAVAARELLDLVAAGQTVRR